ncbi:MAG: Glu-tRNA(Gln) amidotransferase subunit GatE [Candidatus Aenigmarchaeota archaeon]|nr:Glu-tRNA(Gln) amidotransferase subunit GatE [Candidatus Aenigmarchaeota archaeon]
MEEKQVDYKKIGFRCGIEIHQRLDTKKLFCPCKSTQSTEPTLEIVRNLRPSAGELGAIDPAALFEFLKAKTFIYKLSPNESCEVEADEAPPHAMNKEALSIGLEVCKMLESDIPNEIHVMRKTVIDGSNTSGFQRTSVIGINGLLKTSKGNVGILSICLEEESARIEERTEGKVIYRLNGLGIPLVEIATDSTIQSPEHAKEVAFSLGMLLRSTKVQRGIGTIRQDINVSIANGARIEIKGFQQLENVPKVVENEVIRQLTLLEVKDILKKKGVKEKDFLTKENVTGIFRKTESDFIKKAFNEGSVIHSALLPRFEGLLKKSCGDRTLGKELSSYAGVYGLGIIHTDEDLDKYKLYQEFQELRKILKAKEDDLILIIVGKNPNIDKALSLVIERAKQMLLGVPEETRIADGEGSKYTRPLPGSERMYPETDIPSIRITKELIDSIKISKSLIEIQEEISKEIPEQLAEQIVKSPTLLKYYQETKKNFDPVMVANTLTNTLKMLKRDNHDTDKINKDHLIGLFTLIEKKKISKEIIPQALIDMIEGKSLGYIESRYKIIDDSQLRSLVKQAIRQTPGIKESLLMGVLMKDLRGTISGERLMKIIREEMN